VPPTAVPTAMPEPTEAMPALSRKSTPSRCCSCPRWMRP
jgi:hypothetical protein